MKDGQALIPRPDFPQRSRCSWIIRVLQLPTQRLPPGHLGELKLLPLSQCRVTCVSNWWLAKKKRRLPEPLWNEYVGRNERKTPPTRNVKSRSSIELDGVVPCIVWRGKGPGNRKSTTVSAEPRGPVLTPSPTLWGGVNMSGPRKGHTRVPHGLETYGVPAPCITNSWLQEWSARGN